MSEKPDQAVRFQQEATKKEAVSLASNKKTGATCPHCGAALDAKYELCPVCGKKIVDYCTFCGADMGPGVKVCPECGMSGDGVVCPTCGTLNFRSYCYKCQTPLTRAAVKALEKAREDPKVKEAARIISRLAELQSQLTEEEIEQAVPEISPEAKKLMALLGNTEYTVPHNKETAPPKEEIVREYESLVKDVNDVLQGMLPPPGATTPQERTYYSARKQAIIETVTRTVEVTGTVMKQKLQWICNWCGCSHNYPEECTRPELGGEWIYTDVPVTKVVGTRDITTQRKIYK